MRNRLLRRRLRQIGTNIDVQYMLYLNNETPMMFPDKDSVFKYIKNYRAENAIFKLQIYRIETYSL